MSRVYFHSPSGEAELRGSERAWAGGVCEDVTTGIVTPRLGESMDRIMELVPEGHYLHAMSRDNPGWLAPWVQAFQTAWRVELDLNWRGQPLDSWTFSLNTALVLGNDPVKFLARMHGSCEIHGWVEGPCREWLARVMEQGRSVGLYRDGVGWEDVIALLRSRDDEPVVMSYSVCDQFPNFYASDWMSAWPEGVPERWDALSESVQTERNHRAEAWYDLPTAEQWERGMSWLRSQAGMRELTPVGFADFRFGHGLSALDLIAPDRNDRLDRALSLVPTP